jgi:LysM repeat protein
MRKLGIGLAAALLFGGVFSAAAQNDYTVGQGDTLDAIAASFNLELTCLAEANEIENPQFISVGQVIDVTVDCPAYDGFDFVGRSLRNSPGTTPTEPDPGQGGGATVEGEVYTVVRGDTLDTIGQSLNVSVVAIQVANRIDEGEAIFPGQDLIIPADAPAYGLFPALTNPSNPTDGEMGQGGGGGAEGEVYVMQPNETLDGIGARFDIQVTCLAESNSLESPNVIFAGQAIVLDLSCPRYDGYDFVTNPREG